MKEKDKDIVDFMNISNMSYEELVTKRNNIIGFNPDNINECLEAVNEDGYTLEYVKEQTEDICLKAVKQNGYALQYVKEQTKDICLAAVKQNGYALRYVNEQTSEICLAAVKQNGYTLQYVKEQTPEICLTAIKQNGLALKYVKDINMLCHRGIDMKNDTDMINKELSKREKAIAVVELFEHLLDCKEIDIPCSDEEEQSIRYEEGNCARIYGMEYYDLVDDVMNVIYDKQPTGSTKITNGFKSILKKAGRFDSSVAILKKVITCLQDNSVPVDPFVDDNNMTQWRVEGKKCKEQAAQILQIITDEVIINKDDLVGKLNDIYYLIKSDADIKLHNYAIYQSHRKTPMDDMETIRNYLVLADLILNLNTKNEIDPDNSWSVPEGWKYKKEI